MQPKDIFSLAIRLLGLVFVYHGLREMPGIAQAILTAVMGMHGLGLILSLVMAGWPLLVAYWLLLGAPQIMRIAYPDIPAKSKDETEI